MQKASAVLVLAVLLVSLIAGVTAASGYKITVNDGFDTPDRDVELEGSSFTVRGVAGVSPGEQITASATLPEEMSYRVYIYGTQNGERVIMDQKYVDSGTDVSFDTAGYDAGTYTVALYANNDYRAVYPFVVRGVSISPNVPESVTKGDELSVGASVSQETQNLELTGVEAILIGQGTSKRISTNAQSGEYKGTFSTNTLKTGEYRVYFVAKNDSQTPTNDEELVGLSTPQTVSITSQDTGESTVSSPGENDPSTTTTESTTTTAISTTPTSTVTPSTPSTTTTKISETTHSMTMSPETGGGVITASSPTPTQSSTPTTTPGFGFVASCIAIAGLLLVTRSW